jgi:hypothetical protein
MSTICSISATTKDRRQVVALGLALVNFYLALVSLLPTELVTLQGPPIVEKN